MPEFVRRCALLLVLALAPAIALAGLSIARGSALPDNASGAGVTPTWHYTMAEGDSVDAVAGKLLARNRSAAQLLRFNGLSSASELEAGDQLNIPLSWLDRQQQPASVVSLTGNVYHISGTTGRKQALRRDTGINVGDEILSEAGSATVRLADGSELRLSPHSRLMFNRLTHYGSVGLVDTSLRLRKGEVHSRVEPITTKGGHFEIRTPNAVASVKGTVFSMQTRTTGSDIQVTDGAVDFGPPGKTRRIPAGFAASVSTAGSRDLSIRQLPPAPTLDPIPEVLNQLPAELTWQSDWPSRYRLDIFNQETGSWIQSREVSGNRYDISKLDNGRYEIQLAAMDSSGLTGMPDTREVTVDLQAREPSLIAPANGDKLDDDMPEFRWDLNGTNEVARVEVAQTPAFEELVASSEWAPETSALPSQPLSPGKYYWRVVSEAGGDSVARSPARELVINGMLPPVRIISINYLESQVRAFWEKVDTASGYRLQLSQEPGFQNIIKEADVTGTTAALRLIPGRRYFVRVKALTDGPLASRWGPGRELYLE